MEGVDIGVLRLQYGSLPQQTILPVVYIYLQPGLAISLEYILQVIPQRPRRVIAQL